MINLDFLKIWQHTFALHLEYIAEGIEEVTLSASVVGDPAVCQFGKWANFAAHQELSNRHLPVDVSY